MGRKQKEYALYQGDEFITMGTAKEIAKERNTNVKQVLRYNTPTYKNNCKKRERKYEKTYFLVDVSEG